MIDSGFLPISHCASSPTARTHDVKMRWRKGFDDAGGNGKYGVNASRSCWNKLGMPGKMQS